MNDEMMDKFFNAYNYDKEKLYETMLLGKCKRRIFQLSVNTFLVSTSNTTYWFTLN